MHNVWHEWFWKRQGVFRNGTRNITYSPTYPIIAGYHKIVREHVSEKKKENISNKLD